MITLWSYIILTCIAAYWCVVVDVGTPPLPPPPTAFPPFIHYQNLWCLLQFITIGYQEVYPLWALSTVAKGGLDWTTKDIGEV